MPAMSQQRTVCVCVCVCCVVLSENLPADVDDQACRDIEGGSALQHDALWARVLVSCDTDVGTPGRAAVMWLACGVGCRLNGLSMHPV